MRSKTEEKMVEAKREFFQKVLNLPDYGFNNNELIELKSRTLGIPKASVQELLKEKTENQLLDIQVNYFEIILSMQEYGGEHFSSDEFIALKSSYLGISIPETKKLIETRSKISKSIWESQLSQLPTIAAYCICR